MADRNTFTVAWSEEDGEWVATTDKHPSLSCLEETPSAALDGLITLLMPVPKALHACVHDNGGHGCRCEVGVTHYAGEDRRMPTKKKKSRKPRCHARWDYSPDDYAVECDRKEDHGGKHRATFLNGDEHLYTDVRWEDA